LCSEPGDLADRFRWPRGRLGPVLGTEQDARSSSSVEREKLKREYDSGYGYQAEQDQNREGGTGTHPASTLVVCRNAWSGERSMLALHQSETIPRIRPLGGSRSERDEAPVAAGASSEGICRPAIVRGGLGGFPLTPWTERAQR